MLHPDWFIDLQQTAAYSHQCTSIRVIETHISWVFLTGEFAYKIKKPVALGFVDFSTLALRRHYCEEEIRLNRHFTPALYLKVVPILLNAADGKYYMAERAIAGSQAAGPAQEWAVCMRQFDPADGLDQLLEHNRVSPAEFVRFGLQLAQQHTKLPSLPAAQDNSEARILKPALDNFRLTERILGARESESLGLLERHTRAIYQRHLSLFQRRAEGGFIRECHGDLHLRNLVRIDGTIHAFDCLEFNPSLRWIDTWSDVAFLIMDTVAQDHSAHAYGFLDGYLDGSGDYQGVALLNYYAGYRAMVRTKVAALQSSSPADEPGTVWQRYIHQAEAWLAPGKGGLVLCSGLSGSGKSYLAGGLVQQLPAVRLRSDIMRKTLASLPPSHRGNEAVNQGLYSREATGRVYTELTELAVELAAQGHLVILDATFLKTALRESVRAAAAARDLPMLILYCHAPVAMLEQRIRSRLTQGDDPSEAGVQVLAEQIRHFEPPEGEGVISLNTSLEVNVDNLAEQLRERLRSVACGLGKN